jgi:hypothetical protein
MSVWLDSSSNSNKFKQSYFRNFIDVSGDILVRNGLSLKLYDNNIPTRVQFSINSAEFHVYNDVNQTYYDISNTKLIYIQDLSENVQSKFNIFSEKTKHITTDTVTPDTMIELNYIQNSMIIHSDTSFNGSVDICGNFYAQYPDNSIPPSAIIGGIGGTLTFPDVVSFEEDFALIISSGQEVTLNEDNFALIKPLPYDSPGSPNIAFEGGFVIIKIGIEPYTFKRINVTTSLSVSNFATFNGVTVFNNNAYANTPSLYDSSQLIATTAYVKEQNYATPSSLFRQF